MKEAALLRPRVRLALFGLALAVTPACGDAGGERDLRASLGVFYGGQVQQLERVSISRTSAKVIGFRVERALTSRDGELEINWEIVRPGPLGRRVTETGRGALPSGQLRFDHVLETPDRQLGTYNIRVLVEGRIVLDRALLLVPDA